MSTIVEPKAERNDVVEVAWTLRRHVPSGIAVAALVSAAIGMLTLAVVNGSEAG